jgi:hypothetical protein
MTILADRLDAQAVAVEFDEAAIRIVREISAPLAWFPRLRDASAAQRANWRLIGRGEGVHWTEVDEDLSVSALLGLPT